MAAERIGLRFVHREPCPVLLTLLVASQWLMRCSSLLLELNMYPPLIQVARLRVDNA